jgi:hypothetical protein
MEYGATLPVAPAIIHHLHAFPFYRNSYCHWRTKVHAEISRTLNLLAKRQAAAICLASTPRRFPQDIGLRPLQNSNLS